MCCQARCWEIISVMPPPLHFGGGVGAFLEIVVVRICKSFFCYLIKTVAELKRSTIVLAYADWSVLCIGFFMVVGHVGVNTREKINDRLFGWGGCVIFKHCHSFVYHLFAAPVPNLRDRSIVNCRVGNTICNYPTIYSYYFYNYLY